MEKNKLSALGHLPRLYFPLERAAALLDVSENDLLHAGGGGQVCICMNIYGRAENIARTRIETEPPVDDADWELEPGSEEHQLKFERWIAWHRTPMPHGIFELSPDDVRFFEVLSSKPIEIAEAIKFDEGGFWEVEFDPLVVVQHADLVLTLDEVARLGGLTPPDDGLRSRERSTLLRIIDALCVMAKIKERGAATPIVAQLEQLGYRGPTDDTIREVLKQAKELRPK